MTPACRGITPELLHTVAQTRPRTWRGPLDGIQQINVAAVRSAPVRCRSPAGIMRYVRRS